ncbi:MAG TPA: hypothetical protein GXZ21_08850 [Clostridiales bacterium]|nr:hypothetical protein [Clostridiales bacterium]
MFHKGEYIIYSHHGVCYIDEIKENTIDKETKLYYIMHPFNEKSKIMTPVDNDKVRMRPIMSSEEAEEVLESVSSDNIYVFEDRKRKDQVYTQIIRDGDPMEIIKVITSILIDEQEKIEEGKKLSTTDKRVLDKAEKFLYPELSLALGLEIDTIRDRVTSLFQELV